MTARRQSQTLNIPATFHSLVQPSHVGVDGCLGLSQGSLESGAGVGGSSEGWCVAYDGRAVARQR